ncbi:threonine/serine exporter family protein [Ferrimonas pelagia]|uniref:Threonine/serine exporter family protein n=2 Tax=Ferrimonas pelagia TaxID=1177826 RepID=A0ABP9EAK5_9GAMM
MALLEQGALAMIPAVGFALVFNVPAKALKYCAVAGGLGMMVRFSALQQGISIELASFMAASTVGFLGIYWSKRLLAHPKVFTVAAVIPMVPGVFAFKSMIALVELNQRGFSTELFTVLVDNLLKAFFITGGLALGLALPGLLFYRRKSVI